jgi:N-ethylmaleimide reductase
MQRWQPFWPSLVVRHLVQLNAAFKAAWSEGCCTGWADAVAFGVKFIANPDLPARFRAGAALNEPDETTFYAPGPKGYTDYTALAR